MKRFQVMSTALTTNMPFVHVQTDSAAEALAAARKLLGVNAREVQIRDTSTDKFSNAEAFAVEHRLAN